MNEYDLKCQLIGLTVEEARALGYEFVIYLEDGEPRLMTANIDPNRICVAVNNGLITMLHLG